MLLRKLLSALVPNFHGSNLFNKAIDNSISLYNTTLKADNPNEFDICSSYSECVAHLSTVILKSSQLKTTQIPFLSRLDIEKLEVILQFFIVIAIYPIMDENVMIPLHLRLDCPEINFEDLDLKLDRSLSLKKNVEILLSFRSCVEISELFTINKYLIDICAMLFQLGYGFPDKKSEASHFQKLLWSILVNLERVAAFKIVLSLNGSNTITNQTGIRMSQSPAWFQKITGIYLTRLLVTKNSREESPSNTDCLIIAAAKFACSSDFQDSHSCFTADPRKIPIIAEGIAKILCSIPGPAVHPSFNSSKVRDNYVEAISQQINKYLLEFESIKAKELAIVRDSVYIKGFATLSYEVAIRSFHHISKIHGDIGIRKMFSSLYPFLYQQPEDCCMDPIHLTNIFNIYNDVGYQYSNYLFKKILNCLTRNQTTLNELSKLSPFWFYLYSSIIQFIDSDLEISDSAKIILSATKNRIEETIHRVLEICYKDNSSRINLCNKFMNENDFFAKSLYFESVWKKTLVTSQDSNNSYSCDDVKAKNLIPFKLKSDSPFCFDWKSSFGIKSLFEMFRGLTRLTQPKIDEESYNELMVSSLKIRKDVDSLASLVCDFILSTLSKFNQDLLARKDDIVFLQKEESNLLTELLLLSHIMDDCNLDLIWPNDYHKLTEFFSRIYSNYETVENVCNSKKESPAEYRKLLIETSAILFGLLAFYLEYLEKTETLEMRSEILDFLRQKLCPIFNRFEKIDDLNFDSTKQLAFHLKVQLLTRGSVKNQDYSTRFQSTISHRKIIEELDDSCSDKLEDQIFQSKPLEEITPELETIFRQLIDPLIPVQGHALINLSRLLEEKSPIIDGYQALIYKKLLSMLDHEDSYIYLNVIRGLSSLGQTFTSHLLIVFLNYLIDDQRNHEPLKSRSVEFRLKLSEIVMKILKNLGETAPIYRDKVFNVLLRMTQDSEPLIRSASISNIAELCALLRFNIGPIAWDLAKLIETFLIYDKDPTVRQAAAFAAMWLFKDNNSEDKLPEWLPSDIIRNLYRVLSSRRRIERESTVTEQIEAAIAQLDLRARGSVFAFQKPIQSHELIKNIRILD